MLPATFLQSLEQSALAAWVNSSARVLGTISGLHLIGFTIAVGGAFVCGLHMVGAAFGDRPAREVTGTALRVMGVGLSLSLASGILLVTPRAQSAVENWIFVLKMTLLLAAVIALLLVPRLASHADAGSRLMLRVWGVVLPVLWLAVGVAGSAFILLE